MKKDNQLNDVEKEEKKRKPRPSKLSKEKSKKMTEKEIKDLDDLYIYIKDLIGYPNNAPLPNNLSSDLVMRLKGIQVGKYIENYDRKTIGSTDEYGGNGYVGFDVMLLALKLHKHTINFKPKTADESDKQYLKYKILYICKVIENSIIDAISLKQRMDNAEKLAQETVDANVITAEQAEFKSKNKKDNKFLKDLW